MSDVTEDPVQRGRSAPSLFRSLRSLERKAVMEKLLTVKDAAEKLSIAPGSVYHWVSEGRLPCVRFSARCLRFRESDLSRLIDGLSESRGENERPRANKKHVVGNRE